MRRTMLAAAAALLGMTGSAQAGEVFGGVFAHDVEFIGEALGIGAAGKESGVDVHLGYRTGKIDSLGFLGRPKVYGVVSINSEGDSSFAGVGLGWTIDLGAEKRFYLQPGLGLVYTDGADTLPDFREPGISNAEALRRARLRDTNIEFGSKVLFEPELAIGYRFTDRLSAEFAYTHLSNGQILGTNDNDQNDGLDDLGIRIVYQLGGG